MTISIEDYQDHSSSHQLGCFPITSKPSCFLINLLLSWHVSHSAFTPSATSPPAPAPSSNTTWTTPAAFPSAAQLFQVLPAPGLKIRMGQAAAGASRCIPVPTAARERLSHPAATWRRCGELLARDHRPSPRGGICVPRSARQALSCRGTRVRQNSSAAGAEGGAACGLAVADARSAPVAPSCSRSGGSARHTHLRRHAHLQLSSARLGSARPRGPP